jgi:hypothetical protein
MLEVPGPKCMVTSEPKSRRPCQGLWLRWNRWLAYFLFGDHIRTFKHHETGAKLHIAYPEGCHLCTLIWHSITDERHGRNCQAGPRSREIAVAQAMKARWVRLSVHRPYVRYGVKNELGLVVNMVSSNDIKAVEIKAAPVNLVSTHPSTRRTLPPSSRSIYTSPQPPLK